MNERVILITGANGELGIAIARSFLGESADNFVWLGVRRRREAAGKLGAEFAGRCARLLVDEVTPTLDGGTPDYVEEELCELGLMGYVRDFLPPDWRDAYCARGSRATCC